ncbi:hypothetical protein ABPG72_011137 [Tetrahymena utriculariae]
MTALKVVVALLFISAIYAQAITPVIVNSGSCVAATCGSCNSIPTGTGYTGATWSASGTAGCIVSACPTTSITFTSGVTNDFCASCPGAGGSNGTSAKKANSAGTACVTSGYLLIASLLSLIALLI